MSGWSISADTELAQRWLLDTVTSNLGASMESAVGVAMQGILDTAMPLTPLRYGVLRNSYYTRLDHPVPGRVVGTVGNRAEYAWYVHEMPDPTISGHPVNWTTPGTGNKFLQVALMYWKPMFPKIIRDSIRMTLKGQP